MVFIYLFFRLIPKGLQFSGSCFNDVSWHARVATSRSVLGGPDRRHPSARAPPIATEFRPVLARYPRPMARSGAPLADPGSHARAKPQHHLLVAQPPALGPAGRPWRSPR